MGTLGGKGLIIAIYDLKKILKYDAYFHTQLKK